MACHRPSNSKSELDVLPPECLAKPMFVRDKRLLGAGPSNPPGTVLIALSSPMMGHLHPETLQVCCINQRNSSHFEILAFCALRLRYQLLFSMVL